MIVVLSREVFVINGVKLRYFGVKDFTERG